MQSNMGTMDRLVRVIGGSTLVLLAAFGVLGPWAYIGFAPIVTGLFARCPAYRIFGWDTGRL